MQMRAARTVAPEFDAEDWIRRAKTIDRYLQPMPGGLYRSFSGGDAPEEVRREERRLDDELLDPAAHRAVWAALLEWAER